MDVASTIVGGLGTIALVAVGLVIRGLRDDITTLEKTVAALGINVGILLDRDRRRRIKEYEQEQEG